MASYELYPTWIDVDVTGWELVGDVHDCHPTFDEDDRERDALLAKAWANQAIGKPLKWRPDPVVRGTTVFENYVAED